MLNRLESPILPPQILMPFPGRAVFLPLKRFSGVPVAFALVVSGLLALPGSSCRAQQGAAEHPGAPADSAAAPIAPIPAAPPPGSASRAGDTLARTLSDQGLENVSAQPSAGGSRVAFENRHFRHTSSALGIIARATGGPSLVFERRLGLVVAAIPDSGDGVPGRVSYPSDGDFPVPPAGPVQSSTRHSVDLVAGPLLTYELGRILDPTLIRLELQPELRYNPWPGGRLRAALVIPVRNDFSEDDPEHPDINNVRPGPVTLEQFGWSPGAALFSGTAGLLGNNRYGLSAGIARPLRGGEILLDAQSDLSGFIAFNDDAVAYSTPNRWSGFAGVSYRPPHLDLGVRLRAARFIRGDQGIEVEVKRALGDVDVAFFVQRAQGFGIGGVRLVLPIPPLVRPVRPPVRVLPVERFTFAYKEEALPVGQSLANVASREDYLRQLDGPALEANAYRYRAARAGSRDRRPEGAPQWVSLTGMTGFINTPWCSVMGDRDVEFGYNYLPKSAAYQYRGEHPNEVYYAALGFLPRLEVGLRWTVMPGAHIFQYLIPESRYVDSDRMLSGRIEVIEARPGRPGLGIGIEDARGTRRFHSTYAVAGLPFSIYHLQNRVTVGYAPSVFTASRRTLDGLFGACEVSPWRSVAVALEHDTEKWNTMLGINLGFGLRARLALLDLEHLSFGAGWFKAL